jgi:hypothetical protein
MELRMRASVPPRRERQCDVDEEQPSLPVPESLGVCNLNCQQEMFLASLSSGMELS